MEHVMREYHDSTRTGRELLPKFSYPSIRANQSSGSKSELATQMMIGQQDQPQIESLETPMFH